VDDVLGLLERLASTVANGSLANETHDDLRRAVGDLADRMERAVELLRQTLELVKPAAQVNDLRLTPREMEVLSNLGDGLSNAEIAARCWISENTVKFHLKNLFRKLDVRDRAQAIMMARVIQRGLKSSAPSQ
jgi:DNA-binding CsgD family transcriptional regulator